MLFLLRFMATKAAVSSPFFILKPMDLRLCSPVSGGSTLVTTAPMSARTWQQNGPAITCVRSRTFSFSSGNIETRTLHLAVAYAFDCGSLLLPRAGTLLRLTALTRLSLRSIVLLRSMEVVPPSRNRQLKQHSYFIGRGSVGERPSTSTPALGTADKRISTFPLLPLDGSLLFEDTHYSGIFVATEPERGCFLIQLMS